MCRLLLLVVGAGGHSGLGSQSVTFVGLAKAGWLIPEQGLMGQRGDGNSCSYGLELDYSVQYTCNSVWALGTG